MKGVIFNLLEEAVGHTHGEQVWDQLLEATGSAGIYTSLATYPDAEMMAFVREAASMLETSEPAVLRWFGRTSMPRLAERHPEFFKSQPRLLAFVMSLNTIIHPEVRKLLAGAICPHFDFTSMEGDDLRITYRSARGLCALAIGFLEGAADVYGEHVEVAHPLCRHQGDAECVLELRWPRAA